MDPLYLEMTSALRVELQEYGGLIALLEEQQRTILRGEPDAFIDLGAAVHEQVTLLGAHRAARESVVRSFARAVGRSETETLSKLVDAAPAAVGGMLKALIEEINALIDRTQRRLRQNHLLLARCVSAAQEAVVLAGGGELVSTYGNAGEVKKMMPARAFSMAVA